jgi:hypothetical protein
MRSRRMETLAMTEMDSTSMAHLFSHPGADTRQWLSYGLVCQAVAGGDQSVRFTDDTGATLPQGVLVDVTLQPSGITVPCRVGAQSAGNGEGEFNPFGPGDEVLVAVPEGNERAGCVILCRLNNQFDTFPSTVAGADPTQNNISFIRRLVPLIIESGQSVMIRSAASGAQLTIGMNSTGLMGGVILSDGATNNLLLSPTSITLQEATGVALIQIDPVKLTTSIAGNALYFVTPLTPKVPGHAITLEEVCVVIEGFMTAWGLTLAAAVPTLGIGALIAATVTPLTLPGLMSGGLTLASKLALTAEAATIKGILAVAPDPSGAIPGIGKASILL